MSKLSAIIVDDEEFARENIKILLEDNCPDVDITGVAGTVNTAKALISSQRPDVVFLDISMPSGTEGFELLESLDEFNFQVVFVTAHKEYAIQAFEANAAHYLLKPIDIDALINAVEKVKSIVEVAKHDPTGYNEYTRSIQTIGDTIREIRPINRITINHSKGFKIIEDKSIIRLEADGNCTHLFFEDGTKYLDTRTLKIYESILNESMFCRIHKSHLINLYEVQEFLSEDGYFAVLKNGEKIPISRSKLDQFKRQVSNLA
ncbi:MAG: DNA-binding response regulator [Bacteroidetes bacterium]|nr:MAG: DNA-binding response regulator [Bacteroidota bacterium]